MNKKPDMHHSKEKTAKRRRFVAAVMKALAFYEGFDLHRQPKKQSSGKKRSYSQSRHAQLNQSDQEANKSSVMVKAEPDMVKKPSHSSKADNKDNDILITDEEKAALDNVVKELQTDSYEKDEDDFLAFDAEFDPLMLWEDTNLDEYSDLFPPSVIKKLKEQQKRILEGDLQERNSPEISVEDFQEEIFVSEEDYMDDIIISADDFE